MNNQLIVFSSPLHQWRYSQSPSCLCTEVPVKQPFGFPTFPESSTTLHAQRKEYQSFAIGLVLLFPRWPILHLQYPAISSSTYTSRYVLPSLANFPNANFVLLQSRKLMPSGTKSAVSWSRTLSAIPGKIGIGITGNCALKGSAAEEITSNSSSSRASRSRLLPSVIAPWLSRGVKILDPAA